MISIITDHAPILVFANQYQHFSKSALDAYADVNADALLPNFLERNIKFYVMYRVGGNVL